jgi:hypothetical protein
MTIDDVSLAKSRAPAQEAARWLLLVHQIPAKPAYLRVKIWRRLADIGAVALKNAVNALPANEETQEDFEWLLREIVAGGGEAMICEARMVEGLTDTEIRALFDAARDEDYHALIAEMRPFADADVSSLAAQAVRWRKRLSQIVGMDFFGATGRLTAEALLTSIEARLHREEETMPATPPPTTAEALQHRVWVTRQGVHVDRIASAWLIRRFIDPEPIFKFVPSKGYLPQPSELRFDMFEAEYTHEGDRCTFEVLCERCGLGDDPGLKAIAEIVHDVDLKDDKFDREETPGISRLIAGIAMANRDDEERIARGSAVFDDLYEFYRRKGDRADRSQRPPK